MIMKSKLLILWVKSRWALSKNEWALLLYTTYDMAAATCSLRFNTQKYDDTFKNNFMTFWKKYCFFTVLLKTSLKIPFKLETLQTSNKVVSFHGSSKFFHFSFILTVRYLGVDIYWKAGSLNLSWHFFSSSFKKKIRGGPFSVFYGTHYSHAGARQSIHWNWSRRDSRRHADFFFKT